MNYLEYNLPAMRQLTNDAELEPPSLDTRILINVLDEPDTTFSLSVLALMVR